MSTKESAIYSLRDDPDGFNLKPGDTIYTILRHVSRSGMMRVIDLAVIRKDRQGKPTILHIGYTAAKALGDRWDGDNQGIRVGGCGMDMGFHLVYNLGRALFPNGFALEGLKVDKDYNVLARKRPATKRALKAMLRPGSGWRFDGRNGDKSGWDRDGGYAFKHVWL